MTPDEYRAHRTRLARERRERMRAGGSWEAVNARRRERRRERLAEESPEDRARRLARGQVYTARWKARTGYVTPARPRQHPDLPRSEVNRRNAVAYWDSAEGRERSARQAQRRAPRTAAERSEIGRRAAAARWSSPAGRAVRRQAHARWLAREYVHPWRSRWPALPAALLEQRPDLEAAAAFRAWAERCRRWWLGQGVHPDVALYAWGELIAQRPRPRVPAARVMASGKVERTSGRVQRPRRGWWLDALRAGVRRHDEVRGNDLRHPWRVDEDRRQREMDARYGRRRAS